MNPPKVYADFQNLDEFNRVRLTCVGTREDLTRQGIRLERGLVLTLAMDDANDDGEPDELLAEGVVEYNEAEGTWVAAVNWAALRHASDATPETPRGRLFPPEASGEKRLTPAG